jgi:putative NIF3 family GTP cyclohydrolase 1 type 2
MIDTSFKTTFPMSRRRFTQGAAMVAAAGALRPLTFAQGAAPTAAQLVDMIKQHLNMKWNDATYRDTFKAGDPNTRVKAVASCFMSTLDVLKRAQAQGLNFVISHEPTFWSDSDAIEPIKDDPLYLEKRHFVEQNGMVVWRLHDHWHRFVPEPMTEGTERLLKYKDSTPGQRIYTFPPMTLRALAEQVATRLYSRSVRFVGDPDLMVTTMGRGGHPLGGNLTALERADVALASEVREWESVEYVRDLIASGAKKGMIVISHEAGEEEGMVVFSEWLKSWAPQIKTVFVPTHDRMYFA